MLTRPLGHSDLHITPIGFGAWAIGGGGWAFGWGSQDDDDSIACIHEAIEAGINWIDTAAVYGLGHSEEVVAKALHGMKQKPYVFTKCARVWGADRQIGKSLKRESVRRECEASLKRLQVERIDLYQIHWPEPDEDVEEGWETLKQLKAEGKVRWIGVSNFSVSQMQRALKIAPIASNQPPYSLIRRESEAEILPYAHQQNIGIIAYSPMGSGLLTGTMTRERIAAFPSDDWRRTSIHYQEPRLTRNLSIAADVVSMAKKHGKTPAEVAIAWTLANPAVTGAIVGARKPGQIAGFIGAMEWRLPAEDVAWLITRSAS
jgi:aryl-alcohol dehydrogenase-like predicted oxidoreductase